MSSSTYGPKFDSRRYEDFIPCRIPSINIGDTVVYFGGCDPKTGIVKWIGRVANNSDGRIKAWVEMDDFSDNDNEEQLLGPKFGCSWKRAKLLAIDELMLLQDYIPENVPSFNAISDKHKLHSSSQEVYKPEINYSPTAPPIIGWNIPSFISQPSSSLYPASEWQTNSEIAKKDLNTKRGRNLQMIHNPIYSQSDIAMPAQFCNSTSSDKSPASGTQSGNLYDWDWVTFDEQPEQPIYTFDAEVPQSPLPQSSGQVSNPFNSMLPISKTPVLATTEIPKNTNPFLQSVTPQSPKSVKQIVNPPEEIHPKQTPRISPGLVQKSPLLPYQYQLKSVLETKLKNRKSVDWQDLKKKPPELETNNELVELLKSRKSTLEQISSGLVQDETTYLPKMSQNTQPPKFDPVGNGKIHLNDKKQTANISPKPSPPNKPSHYNPTTNNAPNGFKPYRPTIGCSSSQLSINDNPNHFNSSPIVPNQLNQDIINPFTKPASPQVKLPIPVQIQTPTNRQKPKVLPKPKTLPKPPKNKKNQEEQKQYSHQSPPTQTTKTISNSGDHPGCIESKPLPEKYNLTYPSKFLNNHNHEENFPEISDDLEADLPPPPPTHITENEKFLSDIPDLPLPPPPPTTQEYMEDNQIYADLTLPPPPPPLPQLDFDQSTLSTEDFRDSNNNMDAFKRSPVIGDLLKQIQQGKSLRRVKPAAKLSPPLDHKNISTIFDAIKERRFNMDPDPQDSDDEEDSDQTTHEEEWT